MSDENPSQETVTTGQDTSAPAIEVTKIPGEQPDQADTTDSAATSDSDADNNESQSTEKKPKNGIQSRINELTRKNKESQREAEFWKREALKTANPETKPVQRSESKELDPADFTDYGAYQTELAKQEAKKLVSQTLAEQKSQEAINNKVMSTATKGREKYPDFVEVVSNPEVPISPEIFHTLIEMKEGAEILYHLAQNPDEAQKLSQMNPYLAAAEIGRLSAKFTAPAAIPPKTSSAPPPVPTVGGKGTPSVDPSKMTQKEYEAWRMGRSK